MDKQISSQLKCTFLNFQYCDKCKDTFFLYSAVTVTSPREYFLLNRVTGTRRRHVCCSFCYNILKQQKMMHDFNITNKWHYFTWDQIYFDSSEFYCEGPCGNDINKRHLLSYHPTGLIKGFKNCLTSQSFCALCFADHIMEHIIC